MTASEVMNLYKLVVRDNVKIRREIADLIVVVVLSAGDEATLEGLGAAFEDVLPPTMKECVA